MTAMNYTILFIFVWIFHGVNWKNPILYCSILTLWVPYQFYDKRIIFYQNPMFILWLSLPFIYLLFEKFILKP
jgi:hypothetical protein